MEPVRQIEVPRVIKVTFPEIWRLTPCSVGQSCTKSGILYPILVLGREPPLPKQKKQKKYTIPSIFLRL
jgi:hypothetical protein